MKQSWRWIGIQVVCGLVIGVQLELGLHAEDPYLRPPEAFASRPADMKSYTQPIRGTDVTFDMVPIPGGEFLMGSPETEPFHEADEGPQHRVRVEPFWMGKCEVTWNEYNLWRQGLNLKKLTTPQSAPEDSSDPADAVTRPTQEFMDQSFGMGIDGFPAINMTQLSAKMYCHWLSTKTGHYYRLPTEAEWEYACRAGTTTAYSFGDDITDLEDYGWFYRNAGEEEAAYKKVGKKKPNPWGLHDMHGNVSEWCLDQYIPDFYGQFPRGETTIFPMAVPGTLYPRVIRGGSWYDDPEELRSANRIPSSPDWKIQDPQIPQSMWYHTDADFVGFRIVRPFKRPSMVEIQKYVLYPDIPVELRKPE